jgi:hypothetical protein
VAVWLAFSFGFIEALPLLPFINTRFPERGVPCTLTLNEGLPAPRIYKQINNLRIKVDYHSVLVVRAQVVVVVVVVAVLYTELAVVVVANNHTALM